MNDYVEQKRKVSSFACTNCGADSEYKPGTTQLKCRHCGSTNEIPRLEAKLEELDFKSQLTELAGQATQLQASTVKCENCGATSTLEPNIQSAACPYCATPLVLQSMHTENLIRPKALIPFKLNKHEAGEQFTRWVKKLWFAPNDFKSAQLLLEKLKGIYLPFWTYDSRTQSSYIGQRGTYYNTTRTYTDTEGDKTVTRTKDVQQIRWQTVSGNIAKSFDDILIPASHTLPEKYVRALEPWDLAHLQPFAESFLSGFITEKYQRSLQEGFEAAKTVMDGEIRLAIQKEIGGDEQRVHHVDTHLADITFKHILLPVYVCAYTFKEKLYQFIVNAQTGEVQGERPWSLIKISLAAFTAALTIGVIIYFGK